jgi:hypothetical protein
MNVNQNVLPYVRVELQQARAWEARGEFRRAQAHLARAHALAKKLMRVRLRIALWQLALNSRSVRERFSKGLLHA